MSQLQYGRLDGILTPTPSSALTGVSAARRLVAAARGTSNLRVVHALISDSSGFMLDHGLLGGMVRAFPSWWPCFGSGFISSKHNRNKYTRGGGGGDWVWARYGDAVAIGGTGVRLHMQVSGASWTNGTLTLTSAGAFTNYTYRAGDIFTIDSVTSGTAGDYAIASKTSNDAIVLATSPGASASAISGAVNSASGGSSNSAFPSPYAQGWNMPKAWLPHGAGAVYTGSGTGGLSMGHTVIAKMGPLPVNGRLVYSGYGLKGTSGSFTMEMYDWDGASTYTQIGVGTTSANGTAGEYVVGRINCVTGDRTTSNSRDFILASTTFSGGASNSATMCHLGNTLCNLYLPYGSAVQGFFMRGGMSAYDCAALLNFLDDATVDNYLRITRDQFAAGAGGSGSGIANFVFYLGFNDHAETGTSLGGLGAANSSAAGFIDNIKAMIVRIKARWDATFGAGTSDSECIFTIIPSHPISDSPTTPGTGTNAAREGFTQTYRTEAKLFAAGRNDTIVIDLFEALGPTPATMLNGQGYTLVPGSDVIHLNHGGYNFLAGRIANVLDSAL